MRLKSHLSRPRAVALLAILLLLGSCAGPAADDRAGGGVEILFDVKPWPGDQTSRGAALADQTVAILRRRFAGMNVQVQKTSAGKVAVSAPPGTDLQEVRRIAMAPGWVAFRIVLGQADITDDDYESAVESLKGGGAAEVVDVGPGEARWYPIAGHARAAIDSLPFLVEEAGGKRYMLCYDDAGHRLIQSPAWRLTVGEPQDGKFGPILPLKLEDAGGKLLGELTAAHIGHPLAILVDDQVIFAATLQSRLGNELQITFGQGQRPQDLQKQVDELRRQINGGSLPGKLVEVAPGPHADG